MYKRISFICCYNCKNNSADDEELRKARKVIATGQFEKYRQYVTVAGEMCVIGQLVLRGTRIVIPSNLWPRTLALADKSHLGVVGRNTEPQDQGVVARDG